MRDFGVRLRLGEGLAAAVSGTESFVAASGSVAVCEVSHDSEFLEALSESVSNTFSAESVV
jgi:hypothetical protein